MHLKNFDLSQPYEGIELVGLNRQWDLHNFATFLKLEFSPERDDVCLEWKVPDSEKNPWGGRSNNHARGCRLRFIGVTRRQRQHTTAATARQTVNGCGSLRVEIRGELNHAQAGDCR